MKIYDNFGIWDFNLNQNLFGLGNQYFNQTGDTTINDLEAEIKELNSQLATAKNNLCKWKKLLDLVQRANTAERRSTRKERINLSERDACGNTQSLSEFINPSATELAEKIFLFLATAQSGVTKWTSKRDILVKNIKQKQNDLEDLRQEIAESERKEAEAGEADARRRGVETETTGKKFALYGGIALLAIGGLAVGYKIIKG